MNIEIAQVCNIVLATKSALKKRNRIRYKPIYYEKKVEFVFFNNKKYKAKSVEEWFDYCIDRGLQNIKFLIPLPIKDSDFQNFGNIFRKAISILNGEEIENIQKTFYGIYFSELPKINKLLFYASDISDVFGGMGSWNDSPPYYAHKKGLEIEYDSFTEELLTQIRLALLYSVNEW